MKKYRDLETSNTEMCKEIRRLQNKLVNVELADRSIRQQMRKIQNLLYSEGYNKQEIENVIQETENDDDILSDSDQKVSRCVHHNNNYGNLLSLLLQTVFLIILGNQ